MDGSVSWDSVAENAFAVWNEQMARLKVGWTVAPPNSPTSSRDGVTEIQFRSTVYGDSFGSGVLAVTLVSNSGSQMTECDVIFNTAYHFDSYRGPLATNLDFHRIAIHEFGHVLGLDALYHVAPPDARESALSRMLAPGNYTTIVRGVGNTTGVGLVEVYGIQ